MPHRQNWSNLPPPIKTRSTSADLQKQTADDYRGRYLNPAMIISSDPSPRFDDIFLQDIPVDEPAAVERAIPSADIHAFSSLLQITSPQDHQPPLSLNMSSSFGVNVINNNEQHDEDMDCNTSTSCHNRPSAVGRPRKKSQSDLEARLKLLRDRNRELEVERAGLRSVNHELKAHLSALDYKISQMYSILRMIAASNRKQAGENATQSYNNPSIANIGTRTSSVDENAHGSQQNMHNN